MSASFRFRFVSALVFALGLLQAEIAVSGQSDVPTTSPALVELFTEAQRALAQKRWSDVISHAQAVLASSNRKPDDTYAANYFLLEAHKAQRNSAGVQAAIQGMLDSGFPISPETRARLDRALE